MSKQERHIFEQALDLATPHERSSFIASACAQDELLRQRVLGLIAAHELAGTFLPDKTASSTMSGLGDISGSAIESSGAPSDTAVARYQLLEKIGEGGFGIVYLAEQREPVKRKVALKIIKLGMDTRQVVARFEAERQALAMMDHPNIARVLEAGATETGRPYFVMEWVRGVPVTEFCDQNRLSLHERVRLFIHICEAIQHAHQKGIVHRDIKPNNVLISIHDDRPVPKVIDFGIAKAIGHELTDKTVFTRSQEFLGTPAYMSPEQTRAGSVDIDTRSDIYSLGVLLYELLTGQTPFDATQLLNAGSDEMRRRIREDEPLKPSTLLNALPSEDRARIARHRKADSKQLPRALKGDLDWIVMKALEKDRSRRYESASAFAQDLARHLNEEPVSAVAPSITYRLSKFARRHRTALAAASVLGLVLVLSTLVSARLAIRATAAERTALDLLETEQHARRQVDRMLVDLKLARHAADQEALRARAEAASADAVARFVSEDLFGAADPEVEPNRDITLRAVLDRASRRLPASLAQQPLAAASLHTTMGRAYRNLGLYGEAVDHLRAAYDLQLRVSGQHHESTLRAMILYAQALHSADQRQESIPLILKARELVTSALGPSHPLNIKCTVLLATMRYRNREGEAAFRLAAEAFAAACETPEAEETDLFSAMHLVGRARAVETGGAFGDGEMLIKEVLNLSRQRHGDDHLLAARAKHNLAAFYYDSRRKLNEAERLYLDALHTYQRILGDHHDKTLTARANLALLYEVLDRPADVLDQHLRLLQFRPVDVRVLNLMPELLARAPLPPLIERTNTAAWRMTTTRPPANWTASDFDATNWEQSLQPHASEAWFRGEFEASAEPQRPLVFWINAWGDFEVFLNGVRAVEKFGSARGQFQFAVSSPEASAAFRPGRNIITLHATHLRPGAPITVAVYRFPRN
jgi:eukaryotic-like serine/threonine-protein kinase